MYSISYWWQNVFTFPYQWSSLKSVPVKYLPCKWKNVLGLNSWFSIWSCFSHTSSSCCLLPGWCSYNHNNTNYVHLGDLGVDDKIILKLTLKKWCVRVLSHFNWLGIQSIVGSCEDDTEPSSFINGGFLDQVSDQQLLHYLVVLEVLTWMQFKRLSWSEVDGNRFLQNIANCSRSNLV